jgi:hypothetical protein
MKDVLDFDVYETNSQVELQEKDKSPPSCIVKNVTVIDKKNEKTFLWKSIKNVQFNKKNSLTCRTTLVDDFWFSVFNKSYFVFDLSVSLEFQLKDNKRVAVFLFKDCVLKDIATEIKIGSDCIQDVEFVYGDMEIRESVEGVNNGR